MPSSSFHAPPVRRVAMLSVHTSPLAQPGSGDAGGMNVYIDSVARRMARRGVAVDVFTRATSSEQSPRVEVEPGYAVRHVLAGPFGGVAKEDLPGLLCPFAASVLAEAAPRRGQWPRRGKRPSRSGGPGRPGGWESTARQPSAWQPGIWQPGMWRPRYDVVHSHYWLSGQVGLLMRDRWGIPLAHSAHTLARVKNAALAGDDRREPRARELGELEVAVAADMLIAPTETEARELGSLYGADEARTAIVAPGVDVQAFTPGGRGGGTGRGGGAEGDGRVDRAEARAAARGALGLGADDIVLAFVGRIQPHKGPEVLVRAAAEMRHTYPQRRIKALIVGDSSGAGHTEPDRLRSLAAGLGVGCCVRLMPAMPPHELAQVYRAADVVAVPSYSESFGLVALEAQACGTPVVAADVGGLPVAVHDGVSGLLVPGHEAHAWADALAAIALDPVRREAMSRAARAHAEALSWDATVDRLLECYARAAAPRLVSAPSASSRFVPQPIRVGL